MTGPKGTIVFDIETQSADFFWDMKREEFGRLFGYRWEGDEQVTLTTDLDRICEEVDKARWIIGHNIHDFDLPAIFGVHSNKPLELAMAGRVYDTWTHAVLVNPAPFSYINYKGVKALADTPEKAKSWFKLEQQAHVLGVPGKTHDLAALAMEFGDPSLKGNAKKASGFGRIPLDDPRYLEYLRGDVLASQAVAKALLQRGPLDDYAMREQEVEARKYVIRSNGFRVDRERAEARRDELAARREVIMVSLVEKYGFPSEGKAPWSTDQGKTAILAALADAGITEKTRPDWPRNPPTKPKDGSKPAKGAKGSLKLGGEVLIELTKGTDAEEFGQALAELKGQRSLSTLALESITSDGFAHPDISMLQKSGRWSTTKPGLTIWTARGPGAVEKEYFLPDNDDHVLLEIDASNADARGVCWLSGDTEYLKRFEPGTDGHLISALAAWGEEVVLESPETKAHYRQAGKPLTHGWSYGGRANTLSIEAGVPFEVSNRFVNNMDSMYKRVVAWQDAVRKFACQNGYVMSQWGRKMYVDKGREFTQAPALLGQNATREVIADGLLAMPVHVLRTVKAQIHDALVFSVPKKNWEACRDYLINLMSRSYPAPRGGLPMDFPCSSGPGEANWYLAGHA